MDVDNKNTRKDAFEWSSEWRKLSYRIEDQGGVDVITAVYDSEEQWYDPLDFNLDNRPNHPTEKRKQGPGIALARIDPDNYDDVLEFVNRWGLLGLWNVTRYRLAEGLKPKREYTTSFISGKYSTWYAHTHKSGMFRWQEPIPTFSAAVREYQEILKEIIDEESNHSLFDYKDSLNQTTIESDNDIDDSSINTFVDLDGVQDDQFELKEPTSSPESNQEGQYFMLNLRINDCMRQIRPALSWDPIMNEWNPGWNFVSLLDAIYLRLFLDLQANRHWKRCKRVNCHEFFLALNSKAIYCSETCAKTQAKLDSRNDQWIKGLTKLYPNIDYDWLIEQGKSILKKDGIGEKKLFIEIERRVQQLNSIP